MSEFVPLGFRYQGWSPLPGLRKQSLSTDSVSTNENLEKTSKPYV